MCNVAKKKRIHVVGAIFVREQRLLAVQRGAGRNLAGYWEFPGGKIEAGETAAAALLRELREELLIAARVEKFFARVEYAYDFGTVVLDTFLCELGDLPPQLTEHQAMRWLAGSELFSVQWAPADLPIVQQLQTQVFHISAGS